MAALIGFARMGASRVLLGYELLDDIVANPQKYNLPDTDFPISGSIPPMASAATTAICHRAARSRRQMAGSDGC